MSEQVSETKVLDEGNLDAEELTIVDDLLFESNTSVGDEGYDVAKMGVQFFLEKVIKEDEHKGKPINKNLVDSMIAEIDEKLSQQVNEIISNENFKELESSWRGLKFLVDKTNFNENTKVEFLNVSKDELSYDFEDSPEPSESGLYKQIYTEEYGQFGGEPYGMVLGNYYFDPSNKDVEILKSVSKVCSASHAPFIASAAPSLLGVENYTDLPSIKDVKSVYEMPQFQRWNAFRESEESRSIGLTLPRFLLRTPYGEQNPVKSFDFEEDVSGEHDKFVWGNAAFAFASNVTNSFADCRWCSNIIGPKGGGMVSDLPSYVYEADGELQSNIPTEVLVSERKELEFSEAGFISLAIKKGSNNAAFFSANSTQAGKFFPNTKEGKEASVNHKLGSQIPYMFIINRLAHYMKVIQRENIGTWKDRGELQQELNTWLGQYISDQDNPTASVRNRRPLRSANITVKDVEGEVGWYQVSMKVTPHFKYMGSSFTLSLVGKLDKE